ncbi:MAG: hypothetical protein LBG69_05905 [Zoogloeaceae bacterium]|jgi:hypothetical protein|nr:hypothetical protein [Zoogloeaceae bacterium]
MADFPFAAGALAFCPALLFAAPSADGVTPEIDAVEICYNYGCLTRQNITFDSARFAEALAPLRQAENAEEERAALARVLGALYTLAALQSPIGADRGGNYADAGVFGRMDCIDHAATSTGFLARIEKQKGLRWHRVRQPVRRMRFFVLQHYAAAIETLTEPAQIYAVDTWFRDHGAPAVILPLEEWENGKGDEDV